MTLAPTGRIQEELRVRPLVFVPLFALLAPSLSAQTCATGQTFLENDVLPADPGQASVHPFCANPPGNGWDVSSGIEIQW